MKLTSGITAASYRHHSMRTTPSVNHLLTQLAHTLVPVKHGMTLPRKSTIDRKAMKETPQHYGNLTGINVAAQRKVGAVLDPADNNSKPNEPNEPNANAGGKKVNVPNPDNLEGGHRVSKTH